MSCVLTRDLPMPPPPQPPMMPPSPPPGYAIDVSQCYLGGHAHFVVAPHKVSSTAALQTWVVNVHLNLWRAGMNVVLDFPGALHATHSLHVASVTPADVARAVSVTKHSAIVQLQETAARDFKFEALGDVDSVTVVCDIDGGRPPPPPHPAVVDQRAGVVGSAEAAVGGAAAATTAHVAFETGDRVPPARPSTKA